MHFDIIFNATEEAPLYNRYPGQKNAQNAYVEINPEAGTIDAASNPEIGTGVPVSVFDGKIHRYAVSPWMQKSKIYGLLEDIQELLSKVGDYTEGVQAMISALCEYTRIEIGSDPNVWTALEYLAGTDDPDIAIKQALHSHNGDISSLITEVQESAKDMDIVLVEMPDLEIALEAASG